MPHLIYLAIGFPPAAKSSTYRLRETANLFAELGWDVTVVTLHEEAWLRESGLDRSLSEGVNPTIEVVELPIGRADLEPDIRTYSWFRARYPDQWLKRQRKRELASFPEPVFGGWREALEEGVAAVHARRPADLTMVSSTPYTGLAAAWKLWQDYRVPYAIDFRDGWSLNVLTGEEAFSRGSPAGRWESRVFEHAESVWTVNKPIRDFYRARYPERADRIQVVRNGYDPMVITPHSHDPAEGLTFGYLGTASFSTHQLRALLDGWRAAREIDPVLAKSRLVFRGHFGISMVRGMHALLKMIIEAEGDGVVYGGPVPKAQVGDVYSEWDATVLLLAGGEYVTSGKVYDYIGTGLPIMSAHASEHAATEVLEDYPLWVPPPARWSSENAVVSFIKTARMVAAATDRQRAQARAHAEKYARRAVMENAVRELAGRVTGVNGHEGQA
jgi:glycosyltransferase involved in cell wall biosynthesis